MLTVKRINYSIYDQSLVNDIPAGASVLRTESLDPHRLTAPFFSGVKAAGSEPTVTLNRHFKEGSRTLRVFRLLRSLFAFPDTAVGWIPFAYRAGVKAIRNGGIDVIIASAPPNSSAIVAYLLARRTGVPYVLDFRDPWTDDPYIESLTKLHRLGHAVLEHRIVASASAVTVYGEPLLRSFSSRYPGLAGRIEVLTNGFDRDDLENCPIEGNPNGRFRIVYQGSLNWYQERNFQALLAAIKLLPTSLRDVLDFVFVGRYSVRAQQEVLKAGLQKEVAFVPYQPHAEALRYLRSADAALLFVAKGDYTSVTGKVFEYMMVGRPILASVELGGACADLLRRAGYGGWIVAPDDPGALARAIVRLADAGWSPPVGVSVEQFSRKRITAVLSSILNRVSAEATPVGTHFEKLNARV